MRSNWIVAGMAAGLIGLSGCDLLSPRFAGPSGTGGEALLVVREGRATPLPDGSAVIWFVQELSDSRCPANVTCVHAGEAQVQFALVPAEDDSVGFQLTIPGFVNARSESGHASIEIDRFRFTLLALDPYPIDPEVAAPGEAVATLMVAGPQPRRTR